MNDASKILEEFFHPKSIAIAGVSADPRTQGNAYLRELLAFNFKGAIYPLHPKITEILGLKVYQNLNDVPGQVDMVISCIPAQALPQLLDECVSKGVKLLHLYTARLSETGLEEKQVLQNELVKRARESRIRILGPNCMGLFYAREGLSFLFSFPKETGKIGFFSQSGGNSAELLYRGAGRGLTFSKVISYGNGADLNETDFLHYFADDPQTEVIAGYIEGIKDGPKFIQALKKAASHKPTIILKAGRTAAGTRAVSSHTASLAGSNVIWDGLCQQTGTIRVFSMEELSDVLLAFNFLAPSKSRHTLVMGGGGGSSVAASDACEEAGLIVPALPEELRQQIRGFAPEVWALINNPIDGSVTGGPEVFLKAIKIATVHQLYDFIIYNAGPEWWMDHPDGAKMVQNMVPPAIKIGQEAGKPMAVIFGYSDATEEWKWRPIAELQEHCVNLKLPVFPTFERAANAINKFLTYHEGRVS